MKILIIIAGILLALMLLGAIVIFVQNQKPNIKLGVEDGQLTEIPDSPNCVSTQTAKEDKLVEPMAFKDNIDQTKEAMKAALEAYGDIEIVEETADYIYAIATTGTMKFHDDIEIYFDEVAQVIQYRSASRAGYSDMGLNRERYDAIVKAYNIQ